MGGSFRNMPKKGFKSYILKDEIFDFWTNEYKQNKDIFTQQGITSFSAFLTHMMNKSIEQTHTQSEQFMKVVYLKNNLLAIQDNIQNNVVNLLIKKGKITCLLDKKEDCVHVGYAYSIPEVYKLMNKSSNR